MTHTELSRRRALRSVEGFLSALDEYAQRERHPRDRYLFSRANGVIVIQNSLDMPTGLLADLAQLRDALTAQSAEDVDAMLDRFAESDYVIPFDVNTNYRALYAELFNHSRDYVGISTLASVEVDDEHQGDLAFGSLGKSGVPESLPDDAFRAMRPSVEGEWSAPMTRTEMARRITGQHNVRTRKLQSLLDGFGLEQVSENCSGYGSTTWTSPLARKSRHRVSLAARHFRPFPTNFAISDHLRH